MDAASHREARHCRLHAAKFLDGDRQGSKDRLGLAAAGALPVHLAVSMALILIVAPRFWFVAFIDFAIHITVDRIKGIIASRSA